MRPLIIVAVHILCRLMASLAWWPSPVAARVALKMTTEPRREVLFVTNTKCPYAQRTWIALEETATPYEIIEIALYGSGGKPGWFMDLNPKGEVPVLVVDGSPIVGSEETVDFLMQGTLDADASRRRASSRWRAIVDEKLKPVGKRAVLSGGSQADRASLNIVLKELEVCLRDQTGDGPFVCGESFTAEDVSAFPFLQRVHGEFGFPGECERLESWYATTCRRPSVKKTFKKDFWWWW